AALIKDRAEIEEILTPAEAALKNQVWKTNSEWESARRQVEKAQQKAGDDPRLEELRTRADRLLAQIDRDLRFNQRHDDALFYTTLSTGLNRIDSLKRTRDAAKEALEEVGVNPETTTAPTIDSTYVSESRRREIIAGCYELLLIWADA